MRLSSRLAAAASLSLMLAACSPPSSVSGPVGRLIVDEARAQDVPADLMAAIAHVEGGLRLAAVREAHEDEVVVVAGVLELRHGRFNSLARGAALMGVPEVDLVRDLAAGTRAGALVLADLAAQRGIDRRDLAAWAPIVEELSGHLAERDRIDYRARVFTVLYRGGQLPARDGEVVAIAPHDNLPYELTYAPPALAPQGDPEFAGAIWFPTPQNNKWSSGRGGNPVTMIAIHDTEGGWDASVATLQNDGGKSVHYIIDADGSRVGQFIYEADTGWHAGNWYYNQHMVGIEHVGVASQDDYQTALYEVSAVLVRDIAARQGLGPNGDGSNLDRNVLVGHQEVPNGNAISESSGPCSDSPGTCVKSPNYGGAGNHRDPGVFWEWCQYMEIIGNGAHCKCNDAYDLFNCVHDGSEAVKCGDGQTVEFVHCAENSCVVEPIGTDDHCEKVDMGSGGGTGTGGSGAGGGEGGAGAGGAGGGDTGGDGGGVGGGGVGGGGVGGGEGGAGGEGGPGNHEQGGGCAMPSGPAERGGAWLSAALLAMAALASRRRGGGRA
jgi:N-acetyl-anhydromuramyl-L-alanine amidase AmpD